MDTRFTKNDDGAYTLIMLIITTAISDLLYDIYYEINSPNDYRETETRRELRKFFASTWYDTLKDEIDYYSLRTCFKQAIENTGINTDVIAEERWINMLKEWVGV